MTPELSVVIPTRDRPTTLAATLGALARQSVEPARFEVVVVADGEEDTSFGGLRQTSLPFRLTLLSQPRAGAASARNRGTHAATAPIVLFLDDDMEADAHVVREHLTRHAEDGTDVVLGHFSQAWEKPSDPFFGARVRAWWGGRFNAMAQPTHRFGFDDVFSGHFSVRRETLVGVGGFDEEFGPGYAGEDYELGIRLLSAGARFRFTAAARSVHQDYPTVQRALGRAFGDGRGHALIARKHPDVIWKLPLARALDALGKLPWRPGHRPRSPSLALALFEAFKLRRAYGHAFGRAHQRAYWSGVLEELGSPAELGRLLQESDLSWRDRADAAFDVRDGYAHLVDLLSERSVGALDVWVGDEPICRIPHPPGTEPLRPVHVVDHLASEQAWSIVEALARAGWSLDGTPPAPTAAPRRVRRATEAAGATP